VMSNTARRTCARPLPSSGVASGWWNLI
jgi:hypothetical protein